MIRLLPLIFLLGCRAIVVPPAPRPAPPTIPVPVMVLGGVYLPWTEEAEAHWQAVLACVGVSAHRTRPSLWIASGVLRRGSNELAGLYLAPQNAIVVSGAALAPFREEWPLAFWSIVRHEVIHAAASDAEHLRFFTSPEECLFWPPM